MICVYGATGFTGRQAALRVAEKGTMPFTLVGRSAEKLEAVARSLPRKPEIRVADSADPASVAAAVSGARVILSTAGPYTRFGDPVVDAAVAQGIDYVDITGETPWVQGVVDRHHAAAQAKGVRLVSMCGFDSVPSDLGVHLVSGALGPMREVYSGFSLKGGVNGGTVASALGMAATGLALPTGAIRWDPLLERWLLPFFMAPTNTWVVARTAALLAREGAGYGPGFTYEETLETRRRAFAVAQVVGMHAARWVVGRAWGRRWVERLAPAPGEGPSERTMDEGFFRARFVGTAVDGRRALAVVSNQGDPGNRSTVLMLVESAFALYLDRDRLPARAGVLTPATAFGDVLVERLRAAGMVLEVRPLPAQP